MDFNIGSFFIVIDKPKPSIVEGAIEAFTGDAHHTANVISSDSVSEALVKEGVTITKIADFLKREKSVLHVDFEDLSITKRRSIVERWKEWDSSRYDFGGILFQLFKTRSKSRKRIFCSRLTQYGLNEFYKVKGLDYSKFHASPHDIYKSVMCERPSFFKIRWISEGSL